ncbi:MAG: zinc ribbon domain-containing protein [Terracidiphilus sp.]|nr:zinc ribbon domain-containing protein [Terracidiphilus sp.]
MPLYAYRCTQCGHRFEKIQNFSAIPELECPECHGLLERPLTAPRLHFKGAGWYVNDYAAKSSEPASESGSESAPADGKPADSKAPAAKTEGSTPTPASTPAPAAAPSSPTPASTTPSSSTTSSTS